MANQDDFEMPPQVTTEDGEERRVGIEIEFGGLDGRRTARFLAEHLNGRLTETDPYAYRIEGTELGDFEVTLDTAYAHYEGEPDGFFEQVGSKLANLVGAAAELVVPYEVVTPPIRFSDLYRVDGLLRALRDFGGEGTEASVFYAFGLHLNPQAPSLKTESVTAILKAFALLSPWLWREVDPDPTRRLLRFADAYDGEYVAKLADPSYWPELPVLIDDYLAANPSRNRDLDMLPLFAFLDEERVRKSLPHEKIHPRPAFHYRLPDARLGDSSWCLAKEWNHWVRVEKLAQRDKLTALGLLYRANLGDPEAFAKQLAGLAVE